MEIMTPFFSDLFAFSYLVIAHWGAYVIGGAPWAADEGLKRLVDGYARWSERNKPMRRRVEIGALLAGLLFASFQAWQDEHAARTAAEQAAQNTRGYDSHAQTGTARDPDSLYQLGDIVATVVGPRIDRSQGLVTFDRISGQASFDVNSDFEYREYVLHYMPNPAPPNTSGVEVDSCFSVPGHPRECTFDRVYTKIIRKR